jgi:hypothetical protein
MTQTLHQLIVAIAEEKSEQEALCELITDLKHVAKNLNLDFQLALEDSEKLFPTET